MKKEKRKKRKLKKENYHHDKKPTTKRFSQNFFVSQFQKIKLTVNYRDLLSEVNWAMTGQQRA